MGIRGLWPQIECIQEDVHIASLAHKTLAIDGNAFLHRGAHTCATELARGEPTEGYVRWFMRKLAKLHRHKIRAIIVFDGGALPAKSETNATRRAEREANKLRGDQLYREGRFEEARDAYAAAIRATPEMAAEVYAAVARHYRTADVRCIVAPYEADPQIGYLAQTGAIDGVIAEDCDHFVFGVQLVIRYFDRPTEAPGPDRAFAYKREDIFNHRCGTTGFEGFSDSQFMLACCLAKCDYIENIPRVAMKTAIKFVKRYREMEAVMRALEWDYDVPADYAERLERALATFRHQTVFDGATNAVVHLTPLSADAVQKYGDWPDFLGGHIGSALAVDIATCACHPTTHARFQLAAPPAPPAPVATSDDDDAFWDMAVQETQRQEDAHEAALAQQRLEAAAALAPRKRPRDEDSAGDAPARKRARVAEALRIVGTFAGAVAVAWIVVWGLVHV